MPEGDTIHKLAAYLREHLVGRCVLAAELLGRPADLTGLTVTGAAATGKHLLMELSDRSLLRTHLGMYGNWHRYPAAGPAPRMRGRVSVALTVAGPPVAEVFACYNAREVDRLAITGDRARALAVHLGDDLLGPAPDVVAIVARARVLQSPAALLVDVLLDQRIAAGIGNVYKSELLFLAGIAPTTSVGAVDDAALAALFTRARELLQANLGGGPRTTRRAVDGAGRLWVYNRTGRPCHRCGTRIGSARLGQRPRGTWWCPRCQPARRASSP